MSLFSSLFKSSPSPTKRAVETPLDLATYAGSLASNPADIDPILDRVRKITTIHSVGSDLSPEDESALLEVYLDLEKYLMTNDPIRTFTKEELRGRLSPNLSMKLTNHETKGN